ncbi:MAG: hypothetical protein HC798_03955 [Polaribacter sp.]|nr:hypothetical protein [Polaribacter sp.]
MNKQIFDKQGIGPRVLDKNKDIQYLSKELAVKLRDLEEKMIQVESKELGKKVDLKSANKTYKEIMDTLESVGIKGDPLKSDVKEIQKISKKIQLLTTSGGQGGKIDRTHFLRNLANVDPIYSSKIKSLMDDMRDLGALTYKGNIDSGVSTTGIVRDILGGPVKIAAGIANKVAREKADLGKLVNKPGQAVNKAMNLTADKLKSLAPESYETISDLLDKLGRQDFGNAMRSLKNEPEQRRMALMYSLYQQPEFRKMMDDLGQQLFNYNENDK